MMYTHIVIRQYIQYVYIYICLYIHTSVYAKEGLIRQIQFVQLFDVALEKLHIGLTETKLIPVVFHMGVGHRQLFVGHIHPDDETRFPVNDTGYGQSQAQNGYGVVEAGFHLFHRIEEEAVKVPDSGRVVPPQILQDLPLHIPVDKAMNTNKKTRRQKN